MRTLVHWLAIATVVGGLPAGGQTPAAQPGSERAVVEELFEARADGADEQVAFQLVGGIDDLYQTVD